MDVADPDPSVGPLLDILANKRRRIILRCFQHADSYSLRALATHIVTVEQDSAYADVTTSDRHAVYVTLYETHIPQLAGLDLIEYNENTKVAHRGPAFANADRILSCLDSVEGLG